MCLLSRSNYTWASCALTLGLPAVPPGRQGAGARQPFNLALGRRRGAEAWPASDSDSDGRPLGYILDSESVSSGPRPGCNDSMIIMASSGEPESLPRGPLGPGPELMTRIMMITTSTVRRVVTPTLSRRARHDVRAEARARWHCGAGRTTP